MDPVSLEQFEFIISLDQEALNDDQKAFLMARREYMNDEQRKRYSKMIELHEAGKLFKAPDEDLDDLSTLSLATLKEVASEEGVPVKGLKSKAEFIKAIQAHRDGE